MTKGDNSRYKLPLMGIYRITNSVDGKVYIGQSVDIENRFSQHKSALRRSRHYNRSLQAAWNACGEESFKFEVVELIDDQNVLNDSEESWFKRSKCTNSKFGYNKAQHAYGWVSCRHIKGQPRDWYLKWQAGMERARTRSERWSL